MMVRLFLILSLLISFASTVKAETPAGITASVTQAEIISSVEGVGDLNHFQIGVDIKLEKGWKTYWRNPGDVGLSPTFDWSASENLKAAHVNWPAPYRFEIFDMDNFGYKNRLIFPIDVQLKKRAKPLVLKLKLDLLVCYKICIPETHRLSLTIPDTPAIVSNKQPLLAKAAQTIPRTNNMDAFSIQRSWIEKSSPDNIFLYIEALTKEQPLKNTDLFIENTLFVNVSKPIITYDPEKHTALFKAPLKTNDRFEDLQKSFSSFKATFVDKEKSFERDIKIINTPVHKPIKKIAEFAKDNINLKIILFAFLGGLILNFMPCVLPVLSLKILSVLSHGGKGHHIHHWKLFKTFMASALGILSSFWMMAGILSVLKIGGHTIGWGIQFQHPGFLLFLIIILVIFSLNMWGIFEIPVPRFIAKTRTKEHDHSPTLLGHFMTGAFATLLATPCTAPFLGTAIGFALARAPIDIFIVFTFLGLGLGAPYILLAFFPQVFKYMPKPGRWMVTLKKILSIALLLTALWLLNVLVTLSTQPSFDAGWTRFNEALIKPAVQEGRTVFVDVTADWCLTCKANKQFVLKQKDVEEALSAPNILRLQADWTSRDEDISVYLRKYGKYGIPFNIVYGPGAPNGYILNELLSKQEVLHALSEAAGE